MDRLYPPNLKHPQKQEEQVFKDQSHSWRLYYDGFYEIVTHEGLRAYLKT